MRRLVLLLSFLAGFVVYVVSVAYEAARLMLRGRIALAGCVVLNALRLGHLIPQRRRRETAASAERVTQRVYGFFA